MARSAEYTSYIQSANWRKRAIVFSQQQAIDVHYVPGNEQHTLIICITRIYGMNGFSGIVSRYRRKHTD